MTSLPPLADRLSWGERLHGGWVLAGLAARAMLTAAPPRQSLTTRLAQLRPNGAPVTNPVRIMWDAHHIPWIEAGSDTDLAVALGVAHGHLRLGQIDLMRRISQGRLAEIIGPLGIELDRTILLMDLGRAVPAIMAALPTQTRVWAQGFVDGLNHQMATAPLPYEHRLLGLTVDPFTLADFFLLARLVSADISWVVGARLLRVRDKAGAAWPALWPKLLRGGAPSDPAEMAGRLAGLFGRSMRAGSNAAAAAASRTGTGSAMIASDPHLGLALPGNWLIAGMRAPGIHAVGLMIPGMPFVALGRNADLAWGGTSLHAASSELIALDGLAAAAVTTRHVTIQVRGARPRRLALRESPAGPLVSDGMLLRHRQPLALRWVGHAPSDELTAMLGVMRARTIEEFNSALDGFAVPGQTMVCATVDGRVGKRAAVHMPDRPPPSDITTEAAAAWAFSDIRGGAAMPVWLDPADGIIASANEAPDRGTMKLGFFFSPPDRAQRLRAMLAAPGAVTLDRMKALQQDTLHPGALPVRDAMLAGLAPPEDDFTQALRGWDGRYDAQSQGALAYELLLGQLLTSVVAKGRIAALNSVWGTRRLLLEDLADIPHETLARGLATSRQKAARVWRRARRWGDVHRYRPAHHFGAIPLLGRRLRGPFLAAPGGDDTLHKSAHGIISGAHVVRFGACARHVSDLAQPDENYFVLFGGQDGTPGSDTFLDQMTLWQAGGYVRVGMRPGAGVEMTLTPV